MHNPELLDAELITSIQDALVGMKDSEEGQSVLTNVLNTPSIVKNKTQITFHLGNLVKDLPGIQSYFGDKFSISDTVSPTVSNIRIAFEIKEDYTDVDLNPQLLADYVAEETGVEVTLYQFHPREPSSKHYGLAMLTSPSWMEDLLGWVGKSMVLQQWLLT